MLRQLQFKGEFSIPYQSIFDLHGALRGCALAKGLALVTGLKHHPNCVEPHSAKVVTFVTLRNLRGDPRASFLDIQTRQNTLMVLGQVGT